MAKRRYTEQEIVALMEISGSDEESDCESDGEEWLPVEHSDPLSDGDSSSDEGEGPSEQARVATVHPVVTASVPSGSDSETQASSDRRGGSTAGTSAPGAGSQQQSPQEPMDILDGTSAPGASSQQQSQQVPLDMSHLLWVPPNMQAPQFPAFIANSGLMVDMTGNMSPVDVFQQFVNDDFLQFIVEQTNLYAAQFIESHPRSTYTRKWTPTNLPELKVFLGLTFNMGLTKKSQLAMYWSTNPIHHTPLYSSTMPKLRYQMIMRFLHFNDNSQNKSPDNAGRDRLFKLRPLINHLNSKFSEICVPGREIAIDESLMPFHGRLGFKQFIPSKRARYGVKLYKLCESGSGYTFAFRIYEGRDSLLQPEGCLADMGANGKIVVDLMTPLLNKGYHLFVDNFYTSLPLFKFLFSADTVACGTIRANRKGFPQEVLKKKLKKGETCSLCSNEVLALKYKDKKDVLMLSTMHTEGTVLVTSRRSETVKPIAIDDYNKHMGAVDLSDQMLAPYLVARKTKSWYKKVGIYLLQMAMFNAHVAYRKAGNTGSYLQFQEQIIASFLFGSGTTPVRSDQSQCEDIIRLCDRHFMEALPPNPLKKYPQKRCKVCAKHQIRKDTRYYCPDCPSNPGLCFTPCYKIYHTVTNY
ncbi:piggyBac transposable element-derived protein 4-like [Hyperolius riggenbachi]|uniref:piggyBac transposable element-derived protein 4-like n=1 Tax=Hyperolius riggenbachi TaxID=752182 RepID=UPI0035A37042